METISWRATVALTQAQYDDLPSKDEEVQYLITDAEYLKVEYSVNGTDWTTTATDALYMRISTDNGVSWSEAIAVKGADGLDGEMSGPALSTDGNFAAFDGIDGTTLKDSGKSASSFLESVAGDTTPELGGDLDLLTYNLAKTGAGAYELGTDEKQFDLNSNTAFFTLVNNTTGTTIDWRKSNKQTVAPTTDPTYTFTAPGGACNLLLKLTQHSTAVTITWPATVKWCGATPDFATNSAVFIICFFYDGTNYYGTAVKEVSA